MTKEEIQELGNVIIQLVNGAYSNWGEVQASSMDAQALHATLHKLFGDKPVQDSDAFLPYTCSTCIPVIFGDVK